MAELAAAHSGEERICCGRLGVVVSPVRAYTRRCRLTLMAAQLAALRTVRDTSPKHRLNSLNSTRRRVRTGHTPVDTLRHGLLATTVGKRK